MSFVSFYLLKTIWKIVLILASVSTDFNPKIWILASMNTVFDKFNLAALEAIQDHPTLNVLKGCTLI